MVVMWNYLLFLGVCNHQLSALYSSFLYQKIPGTFSKEWTVNLTLFVNVLDGIILYSVDYEGNQFGILVMKDNKHGNRIQIKYNSKSVSFCMKTLCGCDPCNEETMNFIIKSLNTKREIICNDKNTESWSVMEQSDRYIDGYPINKQYPVPKENGKGRKSILFLIGNVGPYTGDDLSLVLPLKDQMIGCLQNFTFNNKSILFLQNGVHVKPNCFHKCFSNVCNGGLCTKDFNNTIRCECSHTILNGPFCNKNLETYIPGERRSYEKIEGATQIKLKMTWETTKKEKYCLLEILGRSSSAILWIKGCDVMMDSRVIATVICEGINFLNVRMTNHSSTLKINGIESTLNFRMEGKVTLNVGFRERKGECDTFQGNFDLHLEPSELKLRDTFSSLATNIPVKVNVVVNTSSAGGFLVCGGLVFVIFMMVSFWRKKAKTNPPDPEVIELDVVQDPEPVYLSSETYSVIDYGHIYSINTASTSNNDVHTNENEDLEQGPTLPQRNDA